MNNLTRLLLGSTSVAAVVLGTNIARADDPSDTTISYFSTGSGSQPGGSNTTYTGTFNNDFGVALAENVTVSTGDATDAMHFIGTGNRSNNNIDFSYSTLASGSGAALRLTNTPGMFNGGPSLSFTSATGTAIVLEGPSIDILLVASQVSGGASGIAVNGGGSTITLMEGVSVTGGIDLTNESSASVISLDSASSLDKIIGATASDTLHLSDGGSTGQLNLSNFANISIDQDSGTWDYSGSASGSAITLNGGVSVLETANAFGSTTVSVSGTAGVEYTVSGTYANNFAIDSNQLTLTADTGVTAALTGLIADSVNGPGALILTGSGTITLQNDNSYSGGTTITGGATAVYTNNFIANGGPATSSSFGIGTLTVNNGTVRIDTDSSIANLINPTVIGSGGGTFDANGHNVGFDTLSGSGALLLEDSNPQTSGGRPSSGFGIGGDFNPPLSGPSFTGSVELGANTFLDYSGSPPGQGFNQSGFSGSDFTLDSGSLLDVRGNTLTVQSLSGTGTITANEAPGTSILKIATASGASHSFSGTITDEAGGSEVLALDIAGAGTQVLSGSNSYTGGTTLESGATLGIGSNSALGAGGLTLNGGTLQAEGDFTVGNATTVSAGSTIDANGHNFTLSSAISGSAGLTFTGGSVTLTNANSYSGTTTINSGATLALTGSGAIASSGVTDNGTFDISNAGANVSIQSLSGTNTGASVSLGANTLNITNASGAFAGVISGTGNIEIAGGTQTLSGTSTYSGTTTIDSGATLAFSATSSVESSSEIVDSGTLDISGVPYISGLGSLGFIRALAGASTGSVLLGNATLYVAGGDGSQVFAGVISGAGGIISNATLALSGVNTYSGITTIYGGATVNLVGSGSIADSSNIYMHGGGTFDISATTHGASIINLTGEGGSSVNLGAETLTITNAAGTFDGSINGSGGGLEIAGGAKTLTGINSYTGTTTIDSGATLALSGSGSIAASSGVILNGTSAFDISGTTSGASITDLSSSSAAASIVLGPKQLNITAASGGTFAGVISGSGGVVDLLGGTLTLSGINTFTNNIQIANGATLKLAGAGSIADAGTVVMSLGTSTLDISGTTNGASVTSLVNGGIINLGSQTLTFTAQGAGFGGSITGTGGVTLTGSSQIFVTSALAYSGMTEVDDAALFQIAGGGSISNSSVLLKDTGSLDNHETTSIVSLAGESGTKLQLENTTLTLSNAGGTFAGSIIDSGGLTIGAGTETLTGNSDSYTGLVTIASGATLKLSGAGSIAASSVADSGTFDISGSTGGVSINSLSGASTGTVALGSKMLTLTNAADTFSGTITGTGSSELLIENGTETLLGANTGFAGMTVIDLGATLKLSNGTTTGSLPGSIINFNEGTVDISNAPGAVTVGSLAGAGTITLGSNTLIVANGSGSYTNYINGAGNVEIAGGHQTFSATQPYTGTTTIDSGATLSIDGGAVDFSHSSKVIASGTFDISGTTIVGINALAGASTGSVVLGNAELAIDGGDGSEVFAGVISGAGGTFGAVTSDGMLVLSGVNTYTGTTVIAGGGSLSLTGNGSIADSSDIHMHANSTFDISATTNGASIISLSGESGASVHLGSQTLTITNPNNPTFQGDIDGSGGVTLAGGNLEFTTSQDYTGPTTIAGGSLFVNSGVTLASTGVVLNTGSIEFGESSAQTLATVSGNGFGTFRVDENSTITINAWTQAGGVLQINEGGGTTVTIHELSGSSSISIGEGSAVVVGDAASTTFSGALQNDGAITKVGAGTLTLAGDDSGYDGTLEISQGTIKTGSTTALGPQMALMLDAAGTLDEDSFSNTIGSLTGTGTITNTGAAGAVLTLANTTTLNATVMGAAGIGIAAGKTLTVASASAFTGPLVIPTTSSVDVTGTGTVTGAAVADNGTFDITGSSATSLSIGSLTGTGMVDIGTKTLVISAGNGTFNGNINGTTGSVNITGGNEILAGTNNTTGTTTVGEGGTLTLASTTSLGTGTIDFKAGSTLKFGVDGTFTNNAVFEAHAPVFDVGANMVTYAGQLSGAGDLAVTGNGGTLILTNTTNSYAGGTEVYGGSTLRVDADSELGAAAPLQLGDATTHGTLQLASSFNLASGRNIVLNAGGGTIDTQAFNSSISQVISGAGGLTKAGTGTLTLSGTNTYTGATAVNAGTLAVTGSIGSSAVTVATGGTLAGTGTVGATTVASGGKLSPGVGGVGTLAVNGALSLASGSTLNADVNTTSADKITVSGAASLGGTLALNAAAGTYAIGTDYKLISATSLSGTFGSITGNTGLNINPTVQYSATGVDLLFGSVAPPAPTTFLFASYGKTANQIAAGTALTASSPTNALYTQLGGLVGSNTAAVAGALTQLSGEIHASMRSAMIQSSHIIRDTVTARADGADPSDGVSLWASGFGGYGSLSGNANATSVHQNTDGGIVGADIGLMPGLRAGIAGAWLAQKINLPGVTSSARGSTTHIIGYANYVSGPIVVDLGGDYGWGASQARRQVSALSENDTDHQSANQGQVFGNVGYRLTGEGGWMAEPYAGLAYVSATTGAFVETGGNGALSGASSTNGQTYSSLGVRGLLGEYGLGSGITLTPHLDFAWQHGFNTLTPGQALTFITAAQSFTVLGVPLEQDAAAIQAGLDFRLMPGLTMSLGYDGNLGSRDQSNFVRGGLEWQF
jgi:fibronectin-binding autotransporter adhesin